MLTSIQSTGVAPELNLKTSMQARKHASKTSALALKPRADVTRTPKQGYQWLHKKDSNPSYKIFLKNDELTGYFSTCVPNMARPPARVISITTKKELSLAVPSCSGSMKSKWAILEGCNLQLLHITIFGISDTFKHYKIFTNNRNI